MTRLRLKTIWSAHQSWLLVAIAFLPWMGGFCVSLTGDLKVHLSHALEMREHGEWLYPLLFGEPSYFKPPLVYWMVMSSWNLFGLNPWATTAPFVGALLATCALLPGLTRGRTSPLASWFFAGCVASLMFGTTAQMEILLALTLTLSARLLLLWSKNGKHSETALDAAIVLAGAAAMIKSPAYSVLLLASIALFLALRGELSEQLRRPRRWFALGFSLVVGGAWFAAVALTDWARVADRYIGREHTSKLAGNGISVVLMLRQFLELCMPWMPLLAIPLVKGIQGLRRKWDVHTQLRISLALPAVLFFVAIPYRMDAYLYFFLPLIVVSLADSLENAKQVKSIWLWIQRAQGILIFVLIAIAAPVLMLAGIASRVGGIAFLAVAVLSLCAGLKGRPRWIAVCALALITVIRLSAVRLGEQDIAGLRHWVAQNPATPITFYDASHDIWHETGYLSMGIGKAIARVHSAPESLAALRAGKMVMVDPDRAPELIAAIERLLEPGDEFYLHREPWLRWKRGIFKINPETLAKLAHPDADGWKTDNQKTFTLLTLN